MRYLPLLLLPLIACASSPQAEPVEAVAATAKTSGAEKEPPQLTSLPLSAHLLSDLDYVYINLGKLAQNANIAALLDEFFESLDRTDPEDALILRNTREALVLVSVEEILSGPFGYQRSISGDAPPADPIKRAVLHGAFATLPPRTLFMNELPITHQSPGAILITHDGKLDASGNAPRFERALELRIKLTDAIREAFGDAPTTLQDLLRGGDELRIAIDVGDPLTFEARLTYANEATAEAAVESLSWQLRQLEALIILLPETLRSLFHSLIVRQSGAQLVVELRVAESTFSSLGTLIEDLIYSIEAGSHTP